MFILYQHFLVLPWNIRFNTQQVGIKSSHDSPGNGVHWKINVNFLKIIVVENTGKKEDVWLPYTNGKLKKQRHNKNKRHQYVQLQGDC